MLKKIVMTTALSLSLAFSATSFAADDLDKVQASKEMSFALSGAYPPFNYVDDKGELTGFDVEVGKEIARRLGGAGKPVATAWDGIIAGLLADRYDTIIGSMAITEERLKAIDFSNPYYHDGAQLFVKNGEKTASIEDLKGKKVGVTLGTTFEKWLRENAPEVEVRTYKGVPQMLLETMNGRIEGFVTTRLAGLIAIKEKGVPLQLAGELLYSESVGIALQKNNPKLKAAINNALAAMQEDGTYAKISQKYFASDIR